MTGASIPLPIRVDVKTGNRLTPHEGDVREQAVWCEGAADGMSEARRKKYAHKISDLRERKKVLAAKRKDAA